MPAAWLVVRATVANAADRAGFGAGPGIRALIAEFDRCWPSVTRTRETFLAADVVGVPIQRGAGR